MPNYLLQPKDGQHLEPSEIVARAVGIFDFVMVERQRDAEREIADMIARLTAKELPPADRARLERIGAGATYVLTLDDGPPTEDGAPSPLAFMASVRTAMAIRIIDCGAEAQKSAARLAEALGYEVGVDEESDT